MLRVYKKIDSRGYSSSLTHRWLTAGLLWCMVFYGIAPTLVFLQTGPITPDHIEIDSAANFALETVPGTGVKNVGLTNYLDWVADTADNNTTPTLTNGVAIGVEIGVTGAAKKGHWNGTRIVDGIAGGEQDIYLNGGKVNEPDSWNIGPGTVGSSKFDGTQMYLANNTTSLFFGMERRGNNGTTAFDFEFNQLPPDQTDPRNNQDGDPDTFDGYIPNRSEDDILISYELQGSGGSSGSVKTYIFKFDESLGTNGLYAALCDDDTGTSTVPDCGGGLFSALNGPNTPPAPWGYVDAGGTWVTSPNMERRLFAEAQVPLSFLPDVGACGGSAFVQIRTRSSSSLTSDAKDTTKVFEYQFGGPTAGALLDSGCGLNIEYDGSSSTNANGGTTGLTYAWTFQRNDGGTWTDVGTRSNVSGTFPAPTQGTYRAKLRVTEALDCFSDVTSNSVTVYNLVGGSATLTADCDDTFGFSATGTGGSGSYNFAWTIYKENGAIDLVAKTFNSTTAAITHSGQLDIDDFNPGAKGAGTYYAVVRITDAADSNCFFDATSNSVVVRYPVAGTATLTADCDDTFAYSASGSLGSGSYNFAWTIYKENGATDLVAKTFNTGPAATSSGTLDIDDFNAGANGEGRYYAIVRITDAADANCFFDATSNAQDVRYPLEASASKFGATIPGSGALDTGFVATVNGSTNALAGDTVTYVWQVSSDGVTWSDTTDVDLSHTETLASIFTLGTIDSPAGNVATGLTAILGDNYKLRRGTLQIRLHAVRTLNGNLCPDDSDPVFVRAIKGIDP